MFTYPEKEFIFCLRTRHQQYESPPQRSAEGSLRHRGKLLTAEWPPSPSLTVVFPSSAHRTVFAHRTAGSLSSAGREGGGRWRKTPGGAPP